MNVLRLSAALMLGLVVGLATAAEDKAVDKGKIVGTWTVTKSAGGVPPNATLVFSKDGKLTITAKAGDKTLTISGTYKVEGNKLSIVMKMGAQEHKETMTIKTLTETKLVTIDAKGKEDEFKKS